MTQHHRDTAPAFLTQNAPPVLLFGGKGGVGKTTSAAATAITLAANNPNESVCLVSTDPAHSVADAIDNTTLPDNLTVAELDAAAEHDAFMSRHADSLHQIAARGTFLEDDEIARFLDLSIPGVDELMCFIRIAEWFEHDHADRYIVDTAPTGHALRLLTMPNLLSEWLEATDALLGKHRYMASVFGSGDDDPVDDFLEHLENAFDNVAAVWADKKLTQFVPVFNAEPMSVAETARLLGDLDTLDIYAPELVLNRLVPDNATGPLAARRAAQRRAIENLPPTIANRDILAVELTPHEPAGEHLAAFFENARTIDPRRTERPDTAGSVADATAPPPAVTGRIEPTQTAERPITLLAGKGGVGKTTMACALALATADDSTTNGAPPKTLLVSTDPAGSLGDALNLDIGPEPTRVTDTLDAVQLDADAELDALKEQYADELENFFENMLPGASLAFEQEAMEHLLDLAPTGIDEVMALVRMTEILDDNAYHALVIDTAPTGHTLRLLELPALVQQWLEAIFAVLVRYEDVFRLPELNERLLRLSRGLKALRAMLNDPATTAVVGVTIPTNLAAAETERLLAGCERAGVPVGGVIVNQTTPDAGDELSAALAQREANAIERIRSTAGGRAVCVVERGEEPAGVAALARLGGLVLGRGGVARRAA